MVGWFAAASARSFSSIYQAPVFPVPHSILIFDNHESSAIRQLPSCLFGIWDNLYSSPLFQLYIWYNCQATRVARKTSTYQGERSANMHRIRPVETGSDKHSGSKLIFHVENPVTFQRANHVDIGLDQLVIFANQRYQAGHVLYHVSGLCSGESLRPAYLICPTQVLTCRLNAGWESRMTPCQSCMLGEKTI